MTVRRKPIVTETAAASPEEALAHFSRRLAFETDCADVHASLRDGAEDFVLLDVRAPKTFATGHVAGAINLPRHKITVEALAAYAPETLIVVYCAGPHCNGATRAAAHIAGLGRAVKEMIGGMTGWIDEGFEVAR